MTTWHGYMFDSLEKFWVNLRNFCSNNRTIFETIFIGLYALEQAGLIVLTFYIKNTQVLILVVSVFAVIVLTTFAIHKLTMESKINLLEKEVNESLLHQVEMENKTRHIIEKHNEIVDAYNNLQSASKSKNIYTSKNK